MSKIIFVSNRLPYHVAKTEAGYESRLSVSGLVTGVQSIFKKHKGVWIGWSGETKETLPDTKPLIKDWEKENYYAVSIPDDLLLHAHESFNNRSLWSLFHYFLDFVNFERKEWEAYKEYNKLFAECALEHYEDGDTIFVNDFQLMLVPQILRKKLPNADIRFFLHITFPTSDVFERLPVGEELIEGLLGANYIGFHTKGHVKAFERAARRVGFNYVQELVKLDVNPIGIDVDFWTRTLKLPETKAKAKWMKDSFGKKKIILATERLDFTKGIKERIQAYDHLLTNHPELRGNVTLVQVAVATRQSVPLYRTIAEEVDQAVGRLNGKYGTLDWTPIRYFNKGFTQEELCALYSISEVGCVTPLIDGLNLVSKEYVMSGSDKRSLILSKFAGSADELKNAIIVNPYDYEEVGEAMYKALNSSNVGNLKDVVRQNTIQDWANRLFKDVE